MIDISEILRPYRETIEVALDSACQFGVGCPEKLREAIRYAVLAPGKRLRPALVMMSAEACGGAVDDAIAPGVAVEMIHAYSLIHDDLPAMDDDDLRRGRPTTHIAFGQATAILAGDALQAQAFTHLYSFVPDPVLAARLMGELAIAAGATGLVGGQEDDLAAENIDVSEFESPYLAQQHLESIHRRKTGALFVACAKMGAIAGGGTEEQVAALGRYADAFGLAFQITDDVLDFTSSAEQLGKRTGKDSGRGKFTFPDLMAAQRIEDSRLESGMEDIPQVEGSKPGNSGFDDSTIATTTQPGVGIDLARQQAAALIRSAQHELELFGARGERLRLMADYILERTT
ncbi:polyprenyl synthetase family protein [Aporhodopirellula aestuarii]|uniref:Polyprenyl synthetase family protein n=1 Tax=Aporhodopirellula aestuarii TaxID=2950107 RepID=A0ABT0UDI5_9BACT|nr:farnesyl diphosphate synthase [Aporhodopirellula aestuarii]MCM2375112.1 polyprenyl synthetase family protein [Aporhodopirellula aestuarii]